MRNHAAKNDLLLHVGSVICALLSLFCLAALWPDIDAPPSAALKPYLAAGFTLFGCAALALYHRARGVGRGQTAFEVALIFVVFALIGGVLAS